MSRKICALALVVLVLSAAGARPSARQQATPAVFTAQQAAAGKAAYATKCAFCHMPDLSGNNEIPQLAGASFSGTWGDRTTKEILDYMVGAMPPGGPSLSAEAYTGIAAYILQSNGAVPGPDALSASSVVRLNTVIRGR